MKRSELYDTVKKMIQITVYPTGSDIITISDKHVRNIVRFIEQNYHNQLFNQSNKKGE